MILNRRNRILLFFLGGIWILFLFLFSNSNGLGFTHDSYYYLAKAKGKEELLGVQRLLVFVLYMLDGDVVTLKYFFLASYLSTFFLLAYLGRRVLGDFQSLIFGFLIATSTPFLMVNSFLWTESFFLVTVAGFLLVLSYKKKAFKLSYYIVLAAVLTFTIWSRKAGLIYAAGCFFSLVLSNDLWSLRRKVIIVIAFALIVFFLYGYGGTPNYIGERPTLGDISTRFLLYLEGLSLWLLPRQVPYVLRILFTLVSLVFFLLFAFRKWGSLSFFWKTVVIVFFFYFTTRVFFLRNLASEVERYLAPIQPFFFLVLIKAISSIVQERFLKSTWAIILLILWLCYPTLRLIKNALLWHNRASVEVSSYVEDAIKPKYLPR